MDLICLIRYGMTVLHIHISNNTPEKALERMGKL